MNWSIPTRFLLVAESFSVFNDFPGGTMKFGFGSSRLIKVSAPTFAGLTPLSSL